MFLHYSIWRCHASRGILKKRTQQKEGRTLSQTTIQLGNRIRRLRQARDWSQEQLAEYADLSLSYIALLEKGG